MMLQMLGFSNKIDRARNHHLMDSLIAYYNWLVFTFFMVHVRVKNNQKLVNWGIVSQASSY